MTIFLMKIIEQHGKIEELTISTYTINREAMALLTQWKEAGTIGKVSLLISSSYSFRDPKWYNEIKDICRANDMRLTYCWGHLKITLAKAGDDCYQFEGSMNYSTNNMAEQISFENNKSTYDSDYEFLHNVIGNRNSNSLEVVC